MNVYEVTFQYYKNSQPIVGEQTIRVEADNKKLAQKEILRIAEKDKIKIAAFVRMEEF